MIFDMNIILIGMPGCGKSTIGVLLAKAMLYHFVDTDLLLQNEYGVSLCDLIEKHGLDGFKICENEILSRISCENTVIATGGSAVYGKAAMEHFKDIGKIVYIKVPLCELEKRVNNFSTRGVVMKNGSTLKDIFEERAPLYEKYADITVELGNGSLTDSAEEIIKALKNA